MRLVFATTSSLVNPLPAFVGASLFANRGTGESIASKLAPTVGEVFGHGFQALSLAPVPVSLGLPAFVGASSLAIRGHTEGIPNQFILTAGAAAGSRSPR